MNYSIVQGPNTCIEPVNLTMGDLTSIVDAYIISGLITMNNFKSQISLDQVKKDLVHPPYQFEFTPGGSLIPDEKLFFESRLFKGTMLINVRAFTDRVDHVNESLDQKFDKLLRTIYLDSPHF